MEEKAQITYQNGIGKDLIIEPTPIQQEVAEAAPQEQPEPTELQQTVASEETPDQPKESWTQRNFKTLKSESVRLARERDEAMALVRQYEQERNRQVNSYNLPPVAEPQSYEYNLDNDALAEGKHVNNLSKELKALKRDLEQERIELNHLKIRGALVKQHSDYEQIVTAENLKALELLKPHLAKAINLNDPYNAGLTCYDLIKEFNIDSNEMEKTEVTKALIKENLGKPKPGIAVAGTKNVNTSPMGRASEFYEGPLTDEMKKIFYKEMQDAIGTTGGVSRRK